MKITRTYDVRQKLLFALVSFSINFYTRFVHSSSAFYTNFSIVIHLYFILSYCLTLLFHCFSNIALGSCRPNRRIELISNQIYIPVN
jgi:hypothetical protein